MAGHWLCKKNSNFETTHFCTTAGRENVWTLMSTKSRYRNKPSWPESPTIMSPSDC
ncbi:hypothetical protein PAMP_015225 [Pampus punctatissimus]